jgi:hypothetical protein
LEEKVAVNVLDGIKAEASTTCGLAHRPSIVHDV